MAPGPALLLLLLVLLLVLSVAVLVAGIVIARRSTERSKAGWWMAIVATPFVLAFGVTLFGGMIVSASLGQPLLG